MDRQVVLEVAVVLGLGAAMGRVQACLLVIAAAKLVAAELEREALAAVPLDIAAEHVVGRHAAVGHAAVGHAAVGRIAGPTVELDSARQLVLVDASMKALRRLQQEVESS